MLVRLSPAQRDLLVEVAIVTDDRRLADDDAHAVVDEEAAPDLRARVDLDAGEPAAEMRDQISESVKSERLARLQALLDRQRQTFNRKMAGRTLDVLIEKPGRHAGQIAGKSPYLQPVQIEGSLDRIGEIVRADIASAGANSLFGRLLPDRAAREAPP